MHRKYFGTNDLSGKIFISSGLGNFLFNKIKKKII